MPRNKPRTLSQKAIIDICITTAGRFDVLKTCLDAIYRDAKTIPLNICLVDNASDAEERISNSSLFEERDDSRAVGFYTKRLQQNIGFPGAAHEVAKMGSSPLILFISDDVELFEGTLQKLIDTMSDNSIGICGTKNLFPETSTSSIRPAGKVQHIGLAMTIKGEIIHPLVGWSKDNPKTCITRDVFAVTGACFIIRRDLFNKAGGFDLIFGKGTYEDVDLNLKVRQLGSRIIINTDALTYHYVGATAEKRKEPFALQQNYQIFMARYMNSGMLIFDSWSYY